MCTGSVMLKRCCGSTRGRYEGPCCHGSLPARRMANELELACYGRVYDGTTGSGVDMAMMYFDEHKLRFIRIPKNACSTVINSLGFSEVRGRNPHHIGNPFSVAPLEAEAWPCLAVLRDPFDRVVSAYLNKFTEILPDELFVHELVEYMWRAQRGLARPSSTSSVTFREFVTHLCAFPDEQLDPHWRSQCSFLRDEKPTIYLWMDTLAEQWVQIPALKEIELRTYAPHATKSALYVGTNVLDVNGEAFLGFREICGQFPAAAQFRDEELVARIKKRFEEDYALIGAAFGGREKCELGNGDR